MESREELLSEENRPIYRSFRRTGMSEAAAFEATIGRGDRSDAMRSELDVDRSADIFESLGMTRAAAEHAAAGREFSSFEEARRAEVRGIQSAINETTKKPAKAKPSGKTQPAGSGKSPDLKKLVEAAVKKAISEQGTGATVEQLSDKVRQIVEADIADLEAGRLPSRRLRRGTTS